MALVQTTLTNSNAGTITTTDNSHDGNLSTYDEFTFGLNIEHTLQWGFDGNPVAWKKFRIQLYTDRDWPDPTYTHLYIYIIPTGTTDPANYTLVYDEAISEGYDRDFIYEHSSLINADGIYVKAYRDTVEGGAYPVQFKEVECWHEAADAGYPNDVNSVPGGNIDSVNGVPGGNIGTILGI